MTESSSVRTMHELIGKVHADPAYNFRIDAAIQLRIAVAAIKAGDHKHVDAQMKVLHVINSIDARNTINRNYIPILDVLRGYVATARNRPGLAIVFHDRAAESWKLMQKQGYHVNAAWMRRNARWRIKARVMRRAQHFAMWLFAISVEDTIEAMVKQ